MAKKSVYVFIVALCLAGVGFSCPALAEVNGVADISGLPVVAQSGARDIPAKNEIAIIELFSGNVNIVPANGKNKLSVDPGFKTELAAGDTLELLDKSRVRVTLKSGDVMHIGANSVVTIDRVDRKIRARVWQGQTALYVVPTLQGRVNPVQVQTANGLFAMNSGKATVMTDKAGVSQVAVLDNRGMWYGNGQEKPQMVRSGRMVQAHDNTHNIVRTPAGLEKEALLKISPEFPILKKAIVAFSNGEKASARKTFEKLQDVYPYNSGAAFYLGQMNLDEGDTGAAISQWQRYEKVDPQGAAKNDIPKHLTVLISEHLDSQIKQALAVEDKLTKAKPEPNSVAVTPFANHSNEKYNMLSKGIAALLIHDLSKVPGLKVLQRMKVQKLLDEIALSESGLVDENSMVRAGRLMKAEKIVLGDFQIIDEK